MTYQKTRKLLSNYIGDFLELNGFKISAFESVGYVLTKVNDDFVNHIGFRKFSRSDGLEYSGGSLSIQLSIVEKIVSPIIIKCRLILSNDVPLGFSTTFSDHSNTEEERKWFLKFTVLRVKGEDDVIAYCRVLKDYLEEYAFPWLAKYSRIEAVNELINSMDDVASADWFAPPHMLRKLVIKKLCKDPSYFSYLQFWKERFEGAKELEGGRYKPYLNAILELEQKLSLYE